MRILAISSQVSCGHVGLSAIVPAARALGHEVVALPTVLLSNHPGHPHVAGETIDPATLTGMLDAIDRNGWLAGISTVLTGYLPSRGHAEFALNAIERISRQAPDAIVVCDPVIGDDREGVYIDQAAATAIRDDILPKADILLPNRFELGWLTGREINTVHDAASAARHLDASHLVVTSLAASQPGLVANALITEEAVRFCESPRLGGVPKGTGDFLSGVFAADPDLARTVARVDALVSASVGRPHLAIAQARDTWVAAPPALVTQLDPRHGS